MEVEFDIIRRLLALSEDFYRACGRTSGSFVAVVRSASTSCDARRLLSGSEFGLSGSIAVYRVPA